MAAPCGPSPAVPGVRRDESTVQRDQDLMKDRTQHLADVNQARERVWVANAPIRDASPYADTAVGGTSSRAGGVVRFFSRGEGAGGY